MEWGKAGDAVKHPTGQPLTTKNYRVINVSRLGETWVRDGLLAPALLASLLSLFKSILKKDIAPEFLPLQDQIWAPTSLATGPT